MSKKRGLKGAPYRTQQYTTVLLYYYYCSTVDPSYNYSGAMTLPVRCSGEVFVAVDLDVTTADLSTSC